MKVFLIKDCDYSKWTCALYRFRKEDLKRESKRTKFQHRASTMSLQRRLVLNPLLPYAGGGDGRSYIVLTYLIASGGQERGGNPQTED